MKIFSIIKKSFKEQIRNFWILILTVSMAPFFVFIYYMIAEATKINYDVVLINQDNGFDLATGKFNHGDFLVDVIRKYQTDSLEIPLRVKMVENRLEAEKWLKNKKSNALVIIPADFSERIVKLATSQRDDGVNVEFIGDLTNINYMVTVIWVNEILSEYIVQVTGKPRPIKIKETGLGISGKIDDFDIWMPGIIILSIIMLMFSATIAIITEVENRTIIRLKLSRVSTFELLTGVSFIQILVGILAVLLTITVAVGLGFNYVGSIWIFLLIAVLTAISIIAFSLILAGATKSSNEVLIVGNFPLFVFMFFSGAAFPMRAGEMFSIAGYSLSWQSLMSPTHAISALNKVWIMDMSFKDIIPEITALILVTILYFIIGLWLFWYRHMRTG